MRTYVVILMLVASIAAVRLTEVSVNKYMSSKSHAVVDGTLSGKWDMVEWDGHTWLQWTCGMYKGSVVHHPDCKCGRGK